MPAWATMPAVRNAAFFEPSQNGTLVRPSPRNALAAWETGNGGIEVGRFNHGANGTGQWSSPTVLSAAGSAASAPVVAVRSDGRIGIALWQTEAGNQRALHWASFDAASGIWSPAPTALATGADEDIAPALAFAQDGLALLAFQHITGIDTATTKRRVRVFGQWFDPSTHTWSKASFLSDTKGTVTPWKPPLVPAVRVTLDGGGQGLAAWRFRDENGGCEEVNAKNFDGASKTWSTVTQHLSGCIDPVPMTDSNLQHTDNVLGATLAPLNAQTTFVLFAQNTAIGATPQARRRANATAPWDLRLQVPQPVVGHSISIGDAGLAGRSDPSALWVQPRGINRNSGYGLYASNYSPAVASCPAQWSTSQKIADVSRLTPQLRTPGRAALPIVVWVDRVGATPHVYVSMRGAPVFTPS